MNNGHQGNEAAAVVASKLTKHYNLNWRKGVLLALEALDLRVHTGEIFGLLGPNGSGKSTTMKLLLGLIAPTTGEASIFGHPAGSMEARRRVGFLPENPYFPAFLTGREVLEYYGKLSGLGREQRRERTEELLKRVVLEHAAERPLRTYSKGMLQRIGLAQALLHNPDLLFLDEPTAGVDPIGSRQMRDLMLQLKADGKTVVFSSHLLEQVEEISDRVAILHQGKKICEGALHELLVVPDGLLLRIPGATEALRNELDQLLQSKNIKGAELTRPRISLEEFFIREIQR
ncbi:MAG: ABC transporter ATP-binding protein [Candidatus Methylacidiphilales bacterium]